MVFEFIIALLLGIFAGVFTGLIPGIHINLIAATIISLPIITSGQESSIIVFIVSLAITHTFIDFIPSIFLGIASEETINVRMPGHRYVLIGEGYKALQLTTIGSIIAIISLIIVAPIMVGVITIGYPFIEKMIGYFLVCAMVLLFYNEKGNRIQGALVFFLAGILGTFTLYSGIKEPLLPLLTGLFGTATVVHTLAVQTEIPRQTVKKTKIKIKEMLRPAYKTILVSPLCSFLPGLGASQAATLINNTKQKRDDKEYLILIGSINTLIIAVSFITLYLIQKSRSGAANAIAQITTMNIQTLLLIGSTILISAIIVYPLTLRIGKVITKRIHHIEYSIISKTVLIVLILITMIISGWQGIIVLISGTILGLYTINQDITRSHLMGAILLPTTLYYLPW